MRLIIHNLGKFLSHRDVKVRMRELAVSFIHFILGIFAHTLVSLHQELVQSALIESNTARDNRVLYKKLVRMTDI